MHTGPNMCTRNEGKDGSKECSLDRAMGEALHALGLQAFHKQERGPILAGLELYLAYRPSEPHDRYYDESPKWC